MLRFEEDMRPEGIANCARAVVWVVALGVVLIGTTGCQTFSMTKEDFAKQQRGEMADPQTGKAVEVVGTFGYYGAMIGAILAGKK